LFARTWDLSEDLFGGIADEKKRAVRQGERKGGASTPKGKDKMLGRKKPASRTLALESDRRGGAKDQLLGENNTYLRSCRKAVAWPEKAVGEERVAGGKKVCWGGGDMRAHGRNAGVEKGAYSNPNAGEKET